MLQRALCALGILAVPCGLTAAMAQQAAPWPPDSVAAHFHTAIRSGAWPATAQRMHPEALSRIRHRIDQLIEYDETGRVRETIIGDIPDARYLDLSDSQVFVAMMEAIGREMRGLLYFLVIEEIEVLGAVAEPPELAHVVYRSSPQLSGAVPEIRVMTLKRTADGWRVLTSPELEVIREAARGFFLREVPPPPPPLP